MFPSPKVEPKIKSLNGTSLPTKDLMNSNHNKSEFVCLKKKLGFLIWVFLFNYFFLIQSKNWLIKEGRKNRWSLLQTRVRSSSCSPRVFYWCFCINLLGIMVFTEIFSIGSHFLEIWAVWTAAVVGGGATAGFDFFFKKEKDTCQHFIG